MVGKINKPLFPSFHRATPDYNKIHAYVNEYIDFLDQKANALQGEGKKISDQSFECSLFEYTSMQKSDSHILLLGGMGPLAGAYSLRETLSVLKEDYSITLFQANFIPKRDGSEDIIHHLCQALEMAVEHCPSHKRLELIVLCNSAHQFIHQALELFYQKNYFKNQELNFHSLKHHVERSIHIFSNKSIALQTSFSAKAGIYGQSLNVNSLEDVPTLAKYQENLQLAIYGLKSFDYKTTLENSLIVFQALKEFGIEQILLGCTEVPVIVDLLKREGTQEIKNYINSIELVDPLNLTLQVFKEQKGKHEHPHQLFEKMG